MARSNLPERNPFFTGREAVLAQLQEALAAQGRAALSGLGGVGKTQTAVEYAQRHLDKYVYSFWATADSREALVSGYVAIVSILGLPEAGAQDRRLQWEPCNAGLALTRTGCLFSTTPMTSAWRANSSPGERTVMYY